MCGLGNDSMLYRGTVDMWHQTSMAVYTCQNP